ncbi:unnamed protein product, partial [Rotaria sp. Silwood2]
IFKLPVTSLRLYNHVMLHIIGSDISNPEDNNKNNHREQKVHVEENKSKHSNDVEPTLHPNKI